MRQMITAKLQRHWDLRAAGNFIGGGAGTGLVLSCTVLATEGLDFRLPLAMGLALVGLGLFCVWMEIGRPWRALNVFFHPQTSWMTREGILAAPLMAAGAGAWWWNSPPLLGLAAVFALGFLFCQARILHAAKGIPAWKQKEAVALIMVTGLAEGAGLAALMGGAHASLMGGAHASLMGAGSAPLLAWALAAGLAREAAWRRYQRGLAASGLAEGALAVFASPRAQAARAARSVALALWGLALAGLPVAAFAGGLAAASGWAFKVLLLTRAAFTRGARVTHAPARGRGLGLPLSLGAGGRP
jgi:phenylacetyl-CoA:acceptor oxidoreductase 26-kDa subunit